MIRSAVALFLLAAPAWAAPPLGGGGIADAIAALRAGQAPEAAAIFLGLAEAGDGEAQFNLALLYLEGFGVPQNAREALYWGWRARLSGIPDAIALLARLDGQATPDLRTETATRLNADLEARIAAGEGRAMLERSVVLSELLPKPDLQGAYVWQAISAALGTPAAAAARDATLEQIEPKNRLDVQQAAIDQLSTLCADQMAGQAICATLP